MFAKVSLDKPFRRVGSSDPRKVVVRRQGHVTTIGGGTNQPFNLMTNRYAGKGTLVKTGPNSVVSIAAMNGTSVLVGPNTTVRITGDGVELVEAPRHARPPRKDPNAPPYRVRTNCALISARG